MGWIYKNPKLAQLLGRALFSVGALFVVCGMIGRVALTAINSTRGLGKLPSLSGLAEAYPTYPLWCVPERIIGYAIPVAVACFGAYVALTAKAARKRSRDSRSAR
jgi:hypothetical protein